VGELGSWELGVRSWELRRLGLRKALEVRSWELRVENVGNVGNRDLRLETLLEGVQTSDLGELGSWELSRLRVDDSCFGRAWELGVGS
jgi:hypothetical protein